MAKTSKPRNDISAQQLRLILNYDHSTGIFTRNGKTAGFIHKGDGYVRIKIHQVSYLAHRLAWLYMTGEWPKHEIDHKFGNRSDNRWKYLREATDAQTAANCGRRKNTLHPFKGIVKERNGRYAARIRVNKKLIYLGVQDTAKQAHKLYAAAAKKYFGKFARI